MQNSGFLSSNTKYWESPLFGCLPLLINYICSYLQLQPNDVLCHVAKGVIILDGFQKLHWNSIGNLRNCVRFSIVTCEMELNVECDSTSTGGTFSPWLRQVLLNCLHFFCTLNLKAPGLSQSFLLPTLLHGACLWTVVLWPSWQNLCCAYSSKKGSR